VATGYIAKVLSSSGTRRGMFRSATLFAVAGGAGLRWRDLITLIGGAAATWPIPVRAQADQVRRMPLACVSAKDGIPPF
jgi:hypothetical protein